MINLNAKKNSVFFVFSYSFNFKIKTARIALKIGIIKICFPNPNSIAKIIWDEWAPVLFKKIYTYNKIGFFIVMMIKKYFFVIFVFFLLYFFKISVVTSQTILLAPDSSVKGAGLNSDPLYKSAAQQIVAILEQNKFNVIEPAEVPQQFIPRKKRPSTEDWKRVFERNSMRANILITLTVTRHIQRSPINQSQIGFRARLFDKNTGIKPIGVIDMAPSGNWTVAPNCFAVCLTAFFAKKAVEPAALIGKKILIALNMND
ncbi:MAG: hypothetical protein CMP14_10840 [Rickettsiales bacterium]|nr:hypothetical protein [Rickettsiales bacterium]